MHNLGLRIEDIIKQRETIFDVEDKEIESLAQQYALQLPTLSVNSDSKEMDTHSIDSANPKINT